jgi:hypothetical protein
MSTIKGLLAQKPTSPVPHVGELHRYSLRERVGKISGKPWTKVKAEGDGYGQLYEVVSVEKTDFVDAHGNVSFNIELVEQKQGGQPIEKTTSAVNAHQTAPATQPVGADFPLGSFWNVYKKNLIEAEALHSSLLPAKIIEGMSEYEFQRLNQVAAISATIQAYK